MTPETISIKGARENNLDNVDVEVPRNKLVVFTGLSGSGKSSLAFDTIYAEGQRRYVESLSAYARQFLELMQKPDVDHIDGMSPAISIEQKTSSRNPRSTVGTVTEIYDYMRLLFARVGIPYSPETGKPIISQTVSEIVDDILKIPNNTRYFIVAPVIRGRKGEYKKDFGSWISQGIQRFQIDGEIYEAENLPELERNNKHNISLIIDRIIMRDGMKDRISQSVESVLRYSEGLVEILFADKPFTLRTYSTKYACPVSGFSLKELEPRIFSFNSPHGACPECDGLGISFSFDPESVIPDKNKSLAEGAIEPWARSGSVAPYYIGILQSVSKACEFDINTPYKNLSKENQHILLYGTGNTKIQFTFSKDGIQKYQVKRVFEGVIGNLQRRLKETESVDIQEQLTKYQKRFPCQSCCGYRLKKESLTVKIAGMHISEVTSLNSDACLEWFMNLDDKLSTKQQIIATRILKEIRERLSFLVNVGLGYLTISRSANTLSGGESQRIRLASQIGSGLTGIVYVMDEPSIGLHQRDTKRLLSTMEHLRDLGNSVIVVEHDEVTIRSADYVFDIGPGAGIHGGKIIAKGTPEEIEKNPNSITGKYLSGEIVIPVPKTRRKIQPKRRLVMTGVKTHNLKNVDFSIPLGLFVCVTGVSGSGKSSLILQTLYPALARIINGSSIAVGPYDNIEGTHLLDKVVSINQSPIGRTPRSNPATYTGVFSAIRDWYAALPLSKERGYTSGRFSFNVKGGRCEACKGDGVIKIEMHFLPDVYVTCETCHGSRYGRETLEVKYNGKSIADILSFTVEEGAIFFKNHPLIIEKLTLMKEVGLGYIRIGQQATTLSGGEAQRIKLAKELSRRATGRTFYLLDEPTTGLHFHDTARLIAVLHRLVNTGNTVVVIEHNLDVIKTADWVIDVGPEGGDLGGHIVVAGTPETIANTSNSHTGRYLFPLLSKKQALKLRTI